MPLNNIISQDVHSNSLISTLTYLFRMSIIRFNTHTSRSCFERWQQAETNISFSREIVRLILEIQQGQENRCGVALASTKMEISPAKPSFLRKISSFWRLLDSNSQTMYYWFLFSSNPKEEKIKHSECKK